MLYDSKTIIHIEVFCSHMVHTWLGGPQLVQSSKMIQIFIGILCDFHQYLVLDPQGESVLPQALLPLFANNISVATLSLNHSSTVIHLYFKYYFLYKIELYSQETEIPKVI